MELLAQGEPKGATFALPFALNEVLGHQFLDVLIGTRSPQIHQIGLQDPLLQGNGGQGAQGRGGEVNR